MVNAISVTGNAVIGRTLTAATTREGATVSYKAKAAAVADGVDTNEVSVVIEADRTASLKMEKQQRLIQLTLWRQKSRTVYSAY
jgi:hypothetical protein